MTHGRSVLLVGATGLVGGACLRMLLADPGVERLVVLTRRVLPSAIVDQERAPKLQARIVDLARLEGHEPLFAVDQIICALGTTIKQAGSASRFREVDLGYPLAMARLGVDRGVRHFLLVSSLGANARSRVLYSRVKGELEDAVRALAFPSVTILRPSVLLGDRREFRLGEEIAKRFAVFAPRRYQPVAAERVAQALVRAAAADAPGVRILESETL